MDYENITKKICRFIKEKTATLNGGVIGLSGGIDSTLVAYLAVKAIGKEKVHGLIIPYGEQSTEDGILVAETLGIKYGVVNIKPMVETFEKNAGYFGEKLCKGNLMARLRMCLLYGAANDKKMLVLGTTNKSEYMIGYATKGGDAQVDIEPIGDLYKTEVWELAKHLGILQHIIDKKPSADLWPSQTDEGEIGMDYFTLDQILQGKTEGIEGKLIKRVEELHKNSEHKRAMPPTPGDKK